MPFANHASAHGGVSTNGLSDICLIFLNDYIVLLEIMFDERAFHSLAVGLVWKKKLFANVSELSN